MTKIFRVYLVFIFKGLYDDKLIKGGVCVTGQRMVLLAIRDVYQSK